MHDINVNKTLYKYTYIIHKKYKNEFEVCIYISYHTRRISYIICIDFNASCVIIFGVPFSYLFYLFLSLSLSPYNMRTLSFKNQYNFFKIIRLVKILCTSGSYFFIRSIFYILVFYNTRVHLTYIK